MSAIAISPELEALKSKLEKTWTSGNWDYFSRFMESSSQEFLERVNPTVKSELLDVACGSGGLCLMAARKGIAVTGVDFAANAIEAARGRAAAEGLDIRFDTADAEKLPYPDASFDYVTSIFGAMFAARPELVAAELLRVCRPGGTIAMGNWTPQGFIGKMFKTVAKYNPPTGAPSPLQWGQEEIVRERFGSGVSELQLRRVIYRFDYPFSPAELTQFFRENFGPLNRAHHNLPAGEWARLEAEFTELWASHNQSIAGGTVVDGEYLYVVAKRAV